MLFMIDVMDKIPDSFKTDIEKAIVILKKAGCKEIFIFGSLVQGKVNMDSDIDIAIKGCPKGLFFGLLGKLIIYLEHPVDLIDLDKQDRLSKFLNDRGELLRVA